MSTLYLVATPIGNLKDITLRAIEVLGLVSRIYTEDTRVSSKLLNAHGIKKQLTALNHHTKISLALLDPLVRGEDVAFVSDAGTPGVNDPGGKLVAYVRENLPEVKIVPLPGASALTALLSVAGIPLEHFVYQGFVPHKKGKKTFLEAVATSKVPTFFFESTHRIEKTLMALADIAPTLQLIVGRELTKLHETLYTGTVLEVLAQLQTSSFKGEFAILAYQP